MRTIITDIDMFVTKLGGPSGVLWVVITFTQIKVFGFRHWWRWGLGMGILVKDDIDALERKVYDKVEDIVDAVEDIVEGPVYETD